MAKEGCAWQRGAGECMAKRDVHGKEGCAW